MVFYPWVFDVKSICVIIMVIVTDTHCTGLPSVGPLDTSIAVCFI